MIGTFIRFTQVVGYRVSYILHDVGLGGVYKEAVKTY